VVAGLVGDAVLGGIVLAGASVQRMAGIGFALVTAPALALLLGAGQGVVLCNTASAAISAIGLATTWRRVRPSAMVPLIAAAGATVPLGTWVAAQLPEPQLLAVMGALITVAVLVVLRGARLASLRGTRGAVAAGAVSGFMNSAAGVGGPPMSLYAVNAGWSVREFVPNAQFYGVIVNAFSLAANGLPHLDTTRWAAVAVALVAGGALGKAVAGRLSEERARLLVLTLALVGGISTLGKGLWGL
jgi:uncharacterized membrane protein YfcA